MTDCNWPDERRLVMLKAKDEDSEAVLLIDIDLLPKYERYRRLELFTNAVACLFRGIDAIRGEV